MTAPPLRLPLLPLVVAVAALLTAASAAGGDPTPDDATALTAASTAGGEEGGDPTLELPMVRVPMCCALDSAFNMSIMECQPEDSLFELAFHYQNGSVVEYPFPYMVKVGFPNCTSYNLGPDTNPDDAFYLLPDGELLTVKDEKRFTEDKFCILKNGVKMNAIVCFPKVEESSFQRVVYGTLYPVGLVVSAVFLAATVAVYRLVVELRDLLGKCLMCSLVALCVAQLCTVVVQVATHTLPPALCTVLGVMMHFWYLAAFLWLNVISFTVCITIWQKSDAGSGLWRRWFLCQSVYAWGGAAAVCVLAVLRDFMHAFNDSGLPKPDFGVGRCWFTDNTALITYFYGPVCVVLAVNVILFIAAAFKLFSLNKKSHARLFQFSLYLKLFVMMGITWIFEAVSFFVQQETGTNSSVNYIWLVFDLINILQGVIIFVVFVCRRAVLMRVCEVLFGQNFARTNFPAYYRDHTVCEGGGGGDADLTALETKHSVI